MGAHTLENKSSQNNYLTRGEMDSKKQYEKAAETRLKITISRGVRWIATAKIFRAPALPSQNNYLTRGEMDIGYGIWEAATYCLKITISRGVRWILS